VLRQGRLEKISYWHDRQLIDLHRCLWVELQLANQSNIPLARGLCCKDSLNVRERVGGSRGSSKVSADQAEEPVDVEVVPHDVTRW